MAPPKVFHHLEGTTSPYQSRPVGMIDGTTALLDRGVAGGIPYGSPRLFGHGLVTSMLLENELQRLRLLQQMSLSASTRAFENYLFFQNHSEAAPLYRPNPTDLIEATVAKASVSSPTLGDASSDQHGSFKPILSRHAPKPTRTKPLVAFDGQLMAVASADAGRTVPPVAVSPVPAAAATAASHTRRRVGRTSIFPAMLHKILADLERQGRSDVASFLPHGKSFVIHKPVEFAKSVLPKYFRMGHFSSFQRQLNLYDFQRVASGADKGAYIHPLFIKGHISLCPMMKRVKIKGAGIRSGGGGRPVSTTEEGIRTDDTPTSDEDDDDDAERDGL